MALTETGLQIRRFPEVQSAIQAAILQNVSTEVIFDEDTLMAQIVNIIAAEISSLEEVVQSVYDSLDRDKAEGSSLDSLLNLIGLQRIGQAATNGLELFTGDDGAVIPQGTILANPSTGDRFETTAIGNLQQAACLSCDYQVGTVSNSTQYTVTVNGGDYSYTSDVSATEEEIVDGLLAQLNTPPDRVWEAAKLATPFRLRVATNNGTNIVLNVQAALVPERVTNMVPIAALEFGTVRAPRNTITQVITAVGGVTSVNNPDALGTGRDRETDEAFRLRASQSLSLSGSATIPAISAALLNLPDVSSALVVENDTGVVVDDRPAKSFECVVTAPITTAIDEAIANTIWNDKPAGIQTVGNTAISITDSTGVQRIINFSRPEGTFIAVRVTYGLYNEEVFPADGPTLIRDAVVTYGSSLAAGEDVIPQRFYGSIYSAVEGIGDLTVECQVLPSQGATPTNYSGQVTSVTDQAGAARFNYVGAAMTVGASITLHGFPALSDYSTTATISASGTNYFELSGVPFVSDEVGVFESWTQQTLPIGEADVASFNGGDVYTVQV